MKTVGTIITLSRKQIVDRLNNRENAERALSFNELIGIIASNAYSSEERGEAIQQLLCDHPYVSNDLLLGLMGSLCHDAMWLDSFADWQVNYWKERVGRMTIEADPSEDDLENLRALAPFLF